MMRLGTRQSVLALAQSGHVAAALGDVELVRVVTEGDRLVDVPLRGPLAKGFFTEALESGLRDGRFDLAVHSLKDLPVEMAAGLVLGAIPRRAPAADLLLVREDRFTPEAAGLPVPEGARIGASSPRRMALLRTARPDCEAAFLRGNVTTRLDRLAQGQYDAIVLAEAGLARLGQSVPAGVVVTRLDVWAWPPAPGQGALAVQCRADDAVVLGRLASFHDADTSACVTAERAWLTRLGGGCAVPFGAFTDRRRFVVGLEVDGVFRVASGEVDAAGEAPLRALDALRQGGGAAVTPRWSTAAVEPIVALG